MFHFKLRHILFAILGLMAAIALTLLFEFASLALQELRSTQRLHAANTLSDAIVMANTHIARERGMTATALAMSGRATPNELDILTQIRGENDRRIQAVLAAAETFKPYAVADRLDSTLQRLNDHYDEFQVARQQADQHLQDKQAGGEEAFIATSTRLIETITALRSAGHSRADTDMLNYILFQEALHTVTELSGRERALLGVVIARERALLEPELQTLWSIRGTISLILEKLRLVSADYTELDEVNRAWVEMEQTYLERFGPLRDAVFLAGRQGQPYPIDASGWYHEATLGIDSLIGYGITVNRVIADRLHARAAHANTTAILMAGIAALILMVVAVAIWLTQRRFLQPLRHLEQATLAIGQGVFSHSLPVQGGDELGQLGSAFETMRTNLAEQMQQRMHAEARVKASARRFRNLVEGIDELLWETDSEDRFTYLSPQLMQILGHDPRAWLGRKRIALFALEETAHPDDRPHEATQPPLTNRGMEHLGTHKNGRPVALESSAVPIFDEQRIFQGHRGVTRDITWRRESETEKQRLLRILEQTRDLILIADLDGIIEYVNSGFEQATGYSRDEVIGRHTRLLKSGLQDSAFYQRLWGTITAGEPFQAALINRRKDGELLYVEQTITPLRDTYGHITHYAWTAKDVTPQRQMDEQIKQSEKLASIGLLAAEVAHEINNPIAYISANITTLNDYLNDLFGLLEHYEKAGEGLADPGVAQTLQALQARINPDYLRQDIGDLLSETIEGINRVHNIVLDLKDLSRRPRDNEWQLTDLHKGLKSTLNITRSEFKGKAEVICQFNDLPRVECLPGQLNQVFLTLLVNAAQAIEQRGSIVIQTGRKGEDVWIEVSDTGKGIAPEHLPRLFEAFFTTKPAGQGTGIGLSVAHRIVTTHGGRIEVDSELGVGTRFRVWLPIRQTARSETTQPST